MEKIHLSFEELTDIKQKITGFVSGKPNFMVLDSNQYKHDTEYNKYELLAGFSESVNQTQTWDFYQPFMSGWYVFNCQLYPQNPDSASGSLFIPDVVFAIRKNSFALEIIQNGADFNAFSNCCLAFDQYVPDLNQDERHDIQFAPETTRNEYIETVHKIKKDIYEGRYYEMNYCIAFKAKVKDQPISLRALFKKLNEINGAPFSALAKFGDTSIICSSPERFICRRGDLIVSQPIKGTNKRLEGAENTQQMDALRKDEKEKAENVMIVDLVRNDLAKVCKPGTVKVPELFGVYPFKSVNHLISTIQGTQQPGTRVTDIFKALYPMGSMTGAPKLEVMKHINLYEHSERGHYSGTLGYFEPGGDFDMNVLIRSLIYDLSDQTISYKVGSAVTYDSVPEKEYEECLLKGERLAEIFR